VEKLPPSCKNLPTSVTELYPLGDIEICTALQNFSKIPVKPENP